MYNAVLRYDEDGDIQKLLEFIDKMESYFKMIELTPSSQIQVAILKLTGTANLLWHYHKQIYNRESANRIKTWDGLKNLLKRNKITNEHERQVLIQLQKIQQTGTVRDYNIAFDKLMMQISELSFQVEMHFYL